MSNKVTSLCRPLQVSAAQKAVLMCVADRADDAGIAWPSIPGICEWTCLSRTAVIVAMRELAAQGLVAIEKATGRNNRCTLSLVEIELRSNDPCAVCTRVANARVRLTHSPHVADAPPPVRQANYTRAAAAPEASISITQAPVKQEKSTVVPWLSLAELVADGLTGETAAAWLDHRRSKKAKLTALAWKLFRVEVAKAAGWSIEEAVLKTIDRQWVAFDAKWVRDDRPRTTGKHTGFATNDYRKGVTADGSLI